MIALLCALCAAPLSSARAASLNLAWDPNSEPEVTGYKIYWSTSSGNYTNNKDVGLNTTCTVSGLEEGQTYYFAATAYSGPNNESGYSNQVTYTVPLSDSDGDGVPDDQDAFPSDPSETVDSDGDGIGNNADKDDDNDRMPDAWEIQYGFNPLANDAAEDADGDGFSNLDEFLAGSDPIIPQDNFGPDTPGLTAPANQALVELTPLLETERFQDPDSGDFHSATHWRVFRETDNVCVFDITSEYSLTELQIPKLILDKNTNYSWQVRYYDNHGTPSAWSGSRSFTTQVDPHDSDSNGIPDDQEVDMPTDLDGDGNWDADQNTIKCVKAGEGKSMGVSFESSGNVVEIESISAESETGSQILSGDTANPDYFPFGLINFKLVMDQPGDSAVITVHFSEPVPTGGRWYKYDAIEATWTDYSSQTEFSADRRSVTVYLEDGGEGDADGSVNGFIVDPSGVGVSATSIGSESGGTIADLKEVTGCFIKTASSQSRKIDAAQIWQEIRGRELAIVLVLLLMLQILITVTRRIRQRWEELQRRYELYHERGGRFTASGLLGPKKLKGVR